MKCCKNNETFYISRGWCRRLMENNFDLESKRWMLKEKRKNEKRDGDKKK